MSANTHHRFRAPLLAFSAAALLAACAARPAGPPVVRWGVDECSSCHMILGDERYAAVARSAAGEEARFDDLGCLLRWSDARPAGSWTVWVHDASGHGWLAADTAFFTRHPGLATPMGSGLRAWASREAGIGSGDLVGSWQQLRTTGAEATASK